LFLSFVTSSPNTSATIVSEGAVAIAIFNLVNGSDIDPGHLKCLPVLISGFSCAAGLTDQFVE
jgi:hypothetical protein